MRICVDYDGVLGDLVQHVQDHFGCHPGAVPADALHAMIASVPDFWLTVPLKFGAHQLWDSIEQYERVILTGCPSTNYDIAAAQKVLCAKRQFGEDTCVITCLGRDKPLHIRSPDDILIDDFRGRVRQWRKAGARAVHYRNFEQAITDLRNLLTCSSPPTPLIG